ncbi:MAG: cytochrome b/b6 domain-containing protein [Chloroflexi bacterium]|nr:cytochrome b/b6 domain-containing protein [Chloroflexota bacterium]
MTTASPIFRTDGYSILSILAHWLAAVLIASLFLTHESERGTAAYVFHVSGGAIAGLILLWRVWHRARRGVAAAPNQWAIFNLTARIVHWGLLVAIVVVVISGYLLPWTLGRELDVFGFGIPSPMEANRGLHEFMERVHDVSGHLFIPLLALHVLGAIKHIVFDRRGAGLRMFKPVSDGR